MLIIALVLAVIGLAALVFAVVSSHVLVAWVCIGASVLGVVLLIVDALRERRLDRAGPAGPPGEAEPAPDAEDETDAGEQEPAPDAPDTADAPDEADAAATVGDDHTNH